MGSLEALSWGIFVGSIAFIVAAIAAGVHDWRQRRAMRRALDQLDDLRERVARLEGRADAHEPR